MTECWNPGDLRAYADRELAPAEAARLEDHLRGCAECAGRYEEVSQRAARVGALLDSLAAPNRKRQGTGWLRRAAAAAIAAALALFCFRYAAPHLPSAAESGQPFVALDSEPIDTGLVVRVALGPDQVQADVIVAPDGRPRAYRLVESSFNKEGVKTQ
jgi:anti-sigma factor RsiW